MEWLMFVLIPLGVILLGLLLTGITFAAAALMTRHFLRMSGMERLAERYPPAGEPEGDLLRRQWVKLGPVYYRRSMDVGIGRRALTLRVKPFLGQYRVAEIPWEQLGAPRSTLLYWQRALEIAIGRPEITRMTCYASLHQRMMQHAPSLSRPD